MNPICRGISFLMSPRLAVLLPFAMIAVPGCQTEEPAVSDEGGAQTFRDGSLCVTIAGSGVEDARITSQPKNQNFGGLPLLPVGSKDEALLRFDLSGVPAGVVIDSASLKLYVNGSAGNEVINVHRATADWAEDGVTFQSFNQQFSPVVEGTIQPNSANALKAVGLTDLVTAWYTGAQPNHGVLLETSDAKKTIFISNEGGTAQYRPALEVCYTPADHCDPDPCQNGGTCANTQDGYTCACPAGYTGTHCETDINECAGDPCQHGSCTDLVDTYSCSCDPGYDGDNCDVDVDECAADPCQHGGVCTDGIANYTCTCDPGYAGTNCEVDIDECAAGPCQNGGTCTDGVDSYTCACPTGFSGANCETNIDDCVGATCQNDSTCVDGIAGHTCACLPGFAGDSCESNIDDCASDPCLNGGDCSDGVNGYTCACAAGWTGDNCEIDIDECESDPCVHGQCVDMIDAYECQCDSGYGGANCDTATESAIESFVQTPESGTIDRVGNGDAVLNPDGALDSIFAATVVGPIKRVSINFWNPVSNSCNITGQWDTVVGADPLGLLTCGGYKLGSNTYVLGVSLDGGATLANNPDGSLPQQSDGVHTLMLYGTYYSAKLSYELRVEFEDGAVKTRTWLAEATTCPCAGNPVWDAAVSGTATYCGDNYVEWMSEGDAGFIDLNGNYCYAESWVTWDYAYVGQISASESVGCALEVLDLCS